MKVRLLESLDEVLGTGAEALVATARARGLLNDVAVGVVKDGECTVRLLGVGVESRFELGSLTKTYTAELLAILVGRGVVGLEDPVAEYLPGVAGGDTSAEAITLEDLATHRSGLPRLPPGMPLLSLDPYAKYDAGALQEYLAAHGLKRPEQQTFLYSNLGYSVLGFALGNAAGTSYAELLESEILGPLGMKDTALALGQKQPALVGGHKQSGIPAPHWHFGVCAPCGGLCSTVGDQLTWMQWLLGDTERLSFQPRAEAVGGGRIGLGWIIPAEGSSCWHNGATFGFSSWMSLDRKRKDGVVILSNRSTPELMNTLGRRLQGCLAGGEPGELKGSFGRAKALLLEPYQVLLSPFSPVLSPIAALPWWVRVPLMGGAVYGAMRLEQWRLEQWWSAR